MRYSLPIAATFVLALPVAGHSCPTSDDLNDGIRFRDGTGWSEVKTRREDQRVVSVSYDDGQISERTVTSNGVFEVEVTFFNTDSGEEETTYTLSYSFDPADHVPLSEEMSIRGKQFETADDGQQYTNRYRIETGRSNRVLIGDCAYIGIPVIQHYGWWWDEDFDEGLYFPELGIYIEGAIDAATEWLQGTSIQTVSGGE